MDGHVSFYKRIEWILLTLSEFVGLQSKSANVIITAPLYVLIYSVGLVVELLYRGFKIIMRKDFVLVICHLKQGMSQF